MIPIGAEEAKWNCLAKNSAGSISNSTGRAPISRGGIGANWNSGELQRADRLATIGALAAGLAHEIGTPMGVIRVRAEDLQQDETFSADSRVKLGVIVRQIDRITRIVRMLLDYARKSESHKAICDLRAIADRALALLEPEAAHRNVKTLARLGEIPLLVNCDADQIEQVFVNMIM